MSEKRIAQSVLPFCWMLLYKVSSFHSVTYILDTTDYVCLFVLIHDIFLICQLSNVFCVPKIFVEYFWLYLRIGINKYIKNRYSVMTQQMPPYSDKGYPPYASIHETKNAYHEVKTRRDARCWNETKEKFHDRYVYIEKYEKFERSKCVARFVGKVPNREGRIHNSYRERRLVGQYN